MTNNSVDLQAYRSTGEIVAVPKLTSYQVEAETTVVREIQQFGERDETGVSAVAADLSTARNLMAFIAKVQK